MFSTKGKTITLDPSTWGDDDYTSFVDYIWRKICIHSHHQQRCENFVQMAALIARTLVGEKRRTWRAIILSTITRRFNIWAVEKLRAAAPDEEKKAKIIRAEGSAYLALFSEYWDEQVEKDINDARLEATPEEYLELKKSIEDPQNKSSAKEIEARKAEFKQSLTSDAFFAQQYAAELEEGYDMTAAMKGKVTVSELRAGDATAVTAVNAELEEREIESKPWFITWWSSVFDEEFNDSYSVTDSLNWTDKKTLLKMDEAHRVKDINGMINYDEAWEMIAGTIKPMSDEMKRLLRPDDEDETAEETKEEEKADEQEEW